MRQFELPPHEWAKYFDWLNSAHEGAETDLLVYDPAHRSLDPGEPTPSLRISGRRLCEAEAFPARISFLLGGTALGFKRYAVEMPDRVIVHELSEGVLESVEIRSIDGCHTYLRFPDLHRGAGRAGKPPAMETIG